MNFSLNSIHVWKLKFSIQPTHNSNIFSSIVPKTAFKKKKVPQSSNLQPDALQNRWSISNLVRLIKPWDVSGHSFQLPTFTEVENKIICIIEHFVLWEYRAVFLCLAGCQKSSQGCEHSSSTLPKSQFAKSILWFRQDRSHHTVETGLERQIKSTHFSVELYIGALFYLNI